MHRGLPLLSVRRAFQLRSNSVEGSRPQKNIHVRLIPADEVEKIQTLKKDYNHPANPMAIAIAKSSGKSGCRPARAGQGMNLFAAGQALARHREKNLGPVSKEAAVGHTRFTGEWAPSCPVSPLSFARCS